MAEVNVPGTIYAYATPEAIRLWEVMTIPDLGAWGEETDAGCHWLARPPYQGRP
jgi:hypothetical protein